VEVCVLFSKLAPKLLVVATFLAIASHAAAGQARVTSADIQRLQDGIDEATRDVAALRGRDASLAERLETELDELRDESVYLEVKLRKNESIARTEYADLRDRLDAIRSRARGDSSARSPSRSEERPSPASGADVPEGTEFDVRLQKPLSSETAQVEDRFEATTLVDLRDGDRVVVPAGSVMRGVVNSVHKAGRVERKGSLTVAFDQLAIGDEEYPIRATVTQALESSGIRGEVGRIGAGAGVGAVIGGILGGFRGVLAGILIGGGGTIAATEGKDVDLPVGTVLRVRLDSPLTLD
jgi:hypothetical protein